MKISTPIMLFKKQKQDIGLPPDELIFRGQQKINQVLLRVIDYDNEQLTEETLQKVSEIQKFKDRNSVTWFNIDGLHNLEVMKEIIAAFDLDQLVIAEVLNTESRPKIIDYSNCTLISLKMLKHDYESATFTIENLSLILTSSVLITFQERKGDVFEPVRERIRNHKKRIRNSGTDYLTFALLDIVVDNYLYILSLLGEKIELLEEKLLINPTQEVIQEINHYKRELKFLRKNIKPAKEMIFNLAKMDSEFLNETNDIHFKELQENIAHANETSDSYREILSDQLNIYHTTISSKLNDIMKFLTVFSVVFIPLTFIAGIYGTNFDNVPELHIENGYYIMWAVMGIIAMGMLVYFKKKKWF